MSDPRLHLAIRGPYDSDPHPHDAALMRIAEGHCPDCSGRLTVHRGATVHLTVGTGLFSSVGEIDPHGYCPACGICVELTRDRPQYVTWRGCPLTDLPPDAFRVLTGPERANGRTLRP